MMVNALHNAAMELRLTDRWSLLKKAGLNLSALAADRQGIYRGKPVQDLPNLSDVERQVILRKLTDQLPRAMSPTPGRTLLASPGAGEGHWTDGHGTVAPDNQQFRHCQKENEVLEREVEGLIAEHRADLRTTRCSAILIGAPAGLLLATSCVSLLGLAILMLLW